MLKELSPHVATAFPFATTLSLEPLIAYWQARETDPNAGIALLARSIGEQVAAAEWARGPILDHATIECNCDLVETLMLAVIPAASFQTAISGVIPPFQRYSFYHTPRFAEVLLNPQQNIKQPLNVDARTMEVYMARMAYALILDKIYGVQLPITGSITFTVPDYNIGLYRHYSVDFDSTFLDVRVIGERPALTSAQLDTLTHNLHRTDLWQELLPPAALNW
ncbi:hypothetical protein H9L05_01660 [Hymenobacter qilianensis]|uniref:Uncharacterized protein n=1 Tax=Hymenobacter qilianensis TaxID=1385715 RepID=A0A7H0GW47_9BACT|nr:hypothetical protein [Hymenobacter qilianensis]QNP52513.1 hypothetical protein H9L05_01660 [Hymenobacter qilianensis]